jgi:hypothetical protein
MLDARYSMLGLDIEYPGSRIQQLLFRASFAERRTDLLGQEIKEGKTLDISYQIPYQLGQVRQLVALHVAQLDLPVEDWAPSSLLLDAIAKTDMRRSVSEPLHCGQETESRSLLDRHRSSNSVSHCIQRNSYIGIKIHLFYSTYSYSTLVRLK